MPPVSRGAYTAIWDDGTFTDNHTTVNISTINLSAIVRKQPPCVIAGYTLRPIPRVAADVYIPYR